MFSVSKLSFFLVFLYFVNVGDSSKLPSFMTACNRDDPNLQKCLLKETKKVLKKFVTGIPDIGVEPIDPLNVGEFNVVTNTNLKIFNKNAVMEGLKDFTVSDANIDLEKKTGEMRVRGNATFTADYSIDGQILIFPIRGKGACRIDMINLDFVMKWQWDFVKDKDGKEHPFISKSANRHRMDRAIIRMDGLFNNDKTLGEAMNNVLNTNWKFFMDEVSPPSIKVVEKKIISIINHFYSIVPYDDLLPLKGDTK